MLPNRDKVRCRTSSIRRLDLIGMFMIMIEIASFRRDLIGILRCLQVPTLVLYEVIRSDIYKFNSGSSNGKYSPMTLNQTTQVSGVRITH
jgi:hypothetical protein